MVIIADSQYLSVNRKLTAYNLFNGINLEIKALFKDSSLFYFTGTELGIVSKDYVIDNNFYIPEYEEVVKELLDGLAVTQIANNIKEKEDINIIGDREWFSKNIKLIKALIDYLPNNNVYLLGYGEDIDIERLKNHFYQEFDIEFLEYNDDYINSL